MKCEVRYEKLHKFCAEIRIDTSLKELLVVLNNHGRHGLLLVFGSLPISVYVN